MTKSIKYENYCIAGVDINTGRWLRPVSDDPSVAGAVLRRDSVLDNGAEADVLDIVEMELIRHAPTDAQYENYIYDPRSRWKKVGETAFEYVSRNYLNEWFPIFGNTLRSVSEDELTGCSLLFMKIYAPEIVVRKINGKVKIRSNFTCNNIRYSSISVGDIGLREKYCRREEGIYSLGNRERFAVFSLTDIYKADNRYYKMLAQLF